MLTFSRIPKSKMMSHNCLWTCIVTLHLKKYDWMLNDTFSGWKETVKIIDLFHTFHKRENNSPVLTFSRIPGDSRSWESPEKADNVWRLFIQILLRQIPNFSPGMWEGTPVKRLTPNSYLTSFSDASESHKTWANLSVRAYFRQFSDW